MKRKLFLPIFFFALLLPALVFTVPVQKTLVFAQESGSKESLTPTFWQRDPDANFEDEGRMHCAPTSVSDGLIYLARAFGMKDLVPGTDKKDQIKLIEELAEEFSTDPSIGGTNPDKVLTGLQSYVKSKGYELSRLEIMTWRSVSDSNKKFKTGTKPDISWMRSAANSKDTVVVFNFGWYHETEDGYTRKGGHWVAVVGGSGNGFTVHNPILPSEQQTEKKSVTLSLLDEDFIVVKDSGEANMKGYYDGEGPGLPRRDAVEAAILDAVIVFSIKKQ
jgi:hypothetical protein